MIKLGISACFQYPDMNRPVFGPKTLSYIENDMARYVTRHGILPVLIPDVSDDLLVEILLEMDGFIFQGGVDIAPETYGEQPIGRWKGDAIRDQYELKIMNFAITYNKPVLGICRGFQLMNVYFGGTLYQDILTQNPQMNEHRSVEKYDTIMHPILFTRGAFLDQVYHGELDTNVNSVHHQAVKKLGENLEVYAKSDDGLIEAFGYTKCPAGRIMGVQWHPEFSHTLGKQVIDADKLFDAFLTHCRNENH